MFRHTSRMSRLLVPIARGRPRPRDGCLRQRLERLLVERLELVDAAAAAARS